VAVCDSVAVWQCGCVAGYGCVTVAVWQCGGGCGSVDVWMGGSVDGWQCGCVAVWMCGSVAVGVCVAVWQWMWIWVWAWQFGSVRHHKNGVSVHKTIRTTPLFFFFFFSSPAPNLAMSPIKMLAMTRATQTRHCHPATATR
jgi:hypothetical protein